MNQTHARKVLWILFCLVLVAAISAMEYRSGKEFSVSIFYLIPISLAAWYTNRNTATVVAVVSFATFFAIDGVLDNTYANRLAPFWNASSRLGIYLLVVVILTSLRDSLSREKELARVDDVTGASNRLAFFEQAEAEIQREQRYKHPVSVAYIDVDDFKAVNDQLGHSAGDRLLRTVAETMLDTVRASDMVARMGGDEFVLLLPETDFDSSQGALKRIVQNLTLAVHRHNGAITFSIGAVTFETPPSSVDALLRKADAVMYEVKSSGKNRIEHRVLSEVKVAGSQAR